MTLEERLRAMAAKGELVHLSLAFYSGLYHAKLATASAHNGYSSAEDADPVAALEKVFAAAPVKVRRPPATRAAREEVTAAVTATEPVEMPGPDYLPDDWTSP